MEKRAPELVVLSDLHLGTFGCRAKELYHYLKSIQPQTLVLNGDIVDIWQFRKRYFPKYHLKVLKQVLSMAAKGTQVYYLTGNHDEILRKFSDLQLGNITLADKLVLDLDGDKAWFFHGDIFDRSIQGARWLARLGGWGYDLLIRMNAISNWCLEKMGRERYSFSRAIKNSVKEAVKYIANFEEVAADLAIEKGYRYVVCGHIHQPQLREVTQENGRCTYLNSGDWIENLTALEYDQGHWELYQHQEQAPEAHHPEEEEGLAPLSLENLIEKITLSPAYTDGKA